MWLAHQALIGWFPVSFRKEVCLLTFIVWFICSGTCYIVSISGLLTLSGLFVSFYIGTKVSFKDILMKILSFLVQIVDPNLMHNMQLMFHIADAKQRKDKTRWYEGLFLNNIILNNKLGPWHVKSNIIFLNIGAISWASRKRSNFLVNWNRQNTMY